MSFTENEKLKALCIVNIFETSRPIGDYAACVVLDDGAGVSYGISQFTHRSGALSEVVGAYLAGGGRVGKDILSAAMPDLHKTSGGAIKRLSADMQFRRALIAAAVTREMKAAQRAIAFEKYLAPALLICEAKGFMMPLSLAVVYDSLNHGSFEYIAGRVTPLGVVRAASKNAALAERAWITEYIRKRDRWLAEVRRLAPTRYRTRFFLEQLAVGNWNLALPMTVHGLRLTDADLPLRETEAVSAHKSILGSAEETVSSAAKRFDRVENVLKTVTTRTDAAKSLWTTVAGTIWQAVWATFGYLAGLPREVWIVVAVTAALLMLAYLYRQIEMGRIREGMERG